MAGNVAVMTRKGQITIPVEIRRALGLKEGDQLSFYREGEEIRVVPTLSVVQRTAGSLAQYRIEPPPTIAEMKDAFERAVAEEVMESMNR